MVDVSESMTTYVVQVWDALTSGQHNDKELCSYDQEWQLRQKSRTGRYADYICVSHNNAES